MKRRTFLFVSSGVLVAAATGAWWHWRPNQPVAAGELLDELVRELKGYSDAGRTWNSIHPEEDLWQRLYDHLDLNAQNRVTPEEMLKKLQLVIQDDFLAGRTFVSNDWILSHTEGRLSALHLRLMGDEAYEAPAVGFEHAEEDDFLRIHNWGPRATEWGEPWHQLTDGRSAFWFQADDPPRSLQVYFGSQSHEPSVGNDRFTFSVSNSLRREIKYESGEHEIWIYDRLRNVKQKVGVFHVGPRPEDDQARFCPIERWGPQETRAGELFNPQPGGYSAFWIRIACVPSDTVVMLEGRELTTTIGTDRVTARVEDADLYAKPGVLTLRLYDKASDEEMIVGKFEVHP